MGRYGKPRVHMGRILVQDENGEDVSKHHSCQNQTNASQQQKAACAERGKRMEIRAGPGAN
jgi:hypothetical protein